MKTKLLPLAAVLSLATFGAQAHTHVEDSAAIQDNGKGAYVKDSDGDIVRDSWNRCVRSSNWTKETAINKCEGIADPKPAPAPVAMPAPVAKPAPVAAPVAMPAPAHVRGLFDTNKAELKSDTNAKLDAYADYMTATPASRITITGHTDSTGAASYNQALSEKRAHAVLGYLAGKGIAVERMTANGMGESAPIASNTTKAGRAENRRVEVEIVQ